MPPAPPDGQSLDGPDGAPVVYLLDAANDTEHRMLTQWLAEERPGAETIRIASSRRRASGDDASLSIRLDAPDEPFLIPTRVLWMAPERKGRRTVGWSDALKPGDPRDPRGLLAWWTRIFHRGRIRLIAARGAFASELVAAYRGSDERDGLAAFVTRRAWRVLDQEERRLRGNRYKIPRFVPEAILSRRSFIDAVHDSADQTGTSREEALRTAGRHLREIAATHSPYVIDVVANAIHTLYRQGYREIRYDDDQVREVAELGSRHPIVFLPSHRSNLDRLALQFMLWENDLPPNHTAGGINIDFFPVGPLVRRTGVFFIRRSFRDDELYKLVLRTYIDYLVEKRFPLEWYLEGGRSRTGKLQPPRFGLLAYLVGSLRRGKAEDIFLIPVSIAYDQIQDVPAYAGEAQGRDKEQESLSWLVRAVRSLRRRYGNIHIRFAAPISVASYLDDIDEGDEESISLQKLAFEVMSRIAEVTPVSPIALVSTALLAARGQPRTAVDLTTHCRWLLDFIAARGHPTTKEARMSEQTEVAGILDWLAEHGNVSSREAAGQQVFWLTDEQMIRVSYYRNMVAHFFVARAVAEMAVQAAAGSGSLESAAVRSVVLGVRDLLKFEFFFKEKAEFVEEVSAELAKMSPMSGPRLGGDGDGAPSSPPGPAVAPWTVLPVLDAYAVVADELAAAVGDFDEKQFLRRCQARARLYQVGNRITGESNSQPLFKSALGLARSRGLLDGDSDVRKKRGEFVQEVERARSWASAYSSFPGGRGA